jgi:hypothetical protein
MAALAPEIAEAMPSLAAQIASAGSPVGATATVDAPGAPLAVLSLIVQLTPRP